MFFFFVLVATIVLLICLWPVETDSLRPAVHPAINYEESVCRIEKLRAADPADVADYGHLIFMTHGHRTAKAVVLYHGYTNCPRQYEKLARMFFERGYNVYVPRVPYHGIGNLVTRQIGKLTLTDITAVCDSAVNVGRGLGEKVTVLGLSMGGVMAAWNAQFRNDVDQAIIIVPSFGWFFFPGVVRPIVNLCFCLPNLFLWWDPINRDHRKAPYSMYHQFSTHGMGHILRLGLSVLRAAQQQPPATKQIVVLTNEADIAVDERATQRLIASWKAHGVPVKFFRFSRSLKMEHDVIDPLHQYEKTDVVYQTIFDHLR
ncbi:MAG TPA: alpha/beta fold hydrolase [Candidatus Bathyarchaeia archaeon]|nr:alpha/beta fold hydrolase [Candidatus Bathyarchaeia archaeon]